MNEQISALMDGEAPAYESEGALSRLKDDAAAREAWDTYHLIGDALRQSESLAGNVAPAVSRRLRDEPTVLAPQRRERRQGPVAVLSAVASVAAVAMVFWVAQQISAVSPAASVQVARVGAEAMAPPAAERLNEYLLAHQEASPSAAIQGLPPFIRTVSETRLERAR